MAPDTGRRGEQRRMLRNSNPRHQLMHAWANVLRMRTEIRLPEMK